MEKRTPTREPVEQFQLRWPPELRDKLKDRAAANRRSVNSEIVVCLEQILTSDADRERSA